ncbi:helix-turn-helix domain-containing protein [Saccharopolyspora mangrovi]|uniref:XRE family transcriptional regulator n=1 Tax=Saccharopolyspora mangrovi TaxID=3082379 RepID=A0ABU6A9D2_9PSEU|nr:XRE family transcriptional regulator [Saccharopolyspora sp. S2-29]MEB3368072.1 XRE family transcriptional regulator [Saccharopolyspora sp. S2-29]
MSEDLPTWARRIRSMREARGWTQLEAAEQMRTHSDKELPDTDHLLRRWKAWERGENKPGSFYASVIAATLGTVTASLFPPQQRATDGLELVTATGMNTLDIMSRLSASDVNEATLQAVRITVDKLCSEYARMPPQDLIREGQQWLRRLVEMQEQRLSFSQRRETLELAGWLALLVGCLEYDLGQRQAAEATRRSALSLGQEVGSSGILGWAHEMRAWFALTSGDYRGVIAAADGGEAAAGNHSVSVQLVAQKAKALARMGRNDEMLKTLEHGRVLLDQMPYPDNVENHFMVDPSKYDFYAMDCYRQVGENRLARELSEEVIRASTDFQGHERWPMRIAEAQVTLGVVAAREGNLDEAIGYGRRALEGDRKSLPSLAMHSQDLAQVLKDRYEGEPEADAYLEQLQGIQRG